MAFEPINTFCHKIDPAGVARLMRETYNATVDGPDDDWETISVAISKKGLFRKAKQFELGHF